jgi:prepilin-type N-terminal cleavage/methylation domain-containing protein
MVNRNSAFSLVELSIVLVILGLLIGGILSGQSLIRASELRAVSTEYQRYYTATQTFRDKYFALPGDLPNATAFWGKDNTNCAGNTGTQATPGTCNGNGNGIMDPAAAASVTGEYFQYWKQLALAGLIEGTYTGIAGAGAASEHLRATNAPASKLSNSMWGVWYAANYAGDTGSYALDYQNAYIFGAQTATVHPNTPNLKPEEAWNIDTKIDDGKPGYGKVVAIMWNNACATGGASETDLAPSVYNLSNTTIICGLRFPRAF